MNEHTEVGGGMSLGNDMLELTTEIVAAYVSNNIVPAGDLPGLINEVHKALNGVQAASEEPEKPELVPAVNPKKSVHQDYIICLEDGKKFKSLKRHLTSHYNMTPEEYREKWGLPADYPMVAPSYSERRSRLAKEKGLGRKKGEKVKR
jgi:predicted transcriptional regulator